MINTLTPAKILVVALSGTLMPCLAFAVNVPSDVSREQVDTLLLGAGRVVPAPSDEMALPVAGWAVQVGAYADKDAALARLARVAERAPDEFTHASRLVSQFAWGNGRILYRARFAGFREVDAYALCATLTRLGESCFAVPVETADRPGGGVIEASAGLAEADDPTKSLLNSSRLVSNAELSGMRGGYFTAAGAQFDFGASIRTLVNGQLALQTNLQWTPAGSVVQQLSGLGAAIQAQVAGDLAKAGIVAPAGGNPVQAASTVQSGSTPPAAPNNAPTAPVDAAQAVTTFIPNIAPAVLTGVPSISGDPQPANPVETPRTVGNAAPTVLTGVQIQNPSGGLTQVFSNVNATQIQNIVLNSASNQVITQNTNVTLTIYNFSAWQQQLMQHAMSAQLANEILAASGFNGGH